jgi:protoporphyrinogen oxidase
VIYCGTAFKLAELQVEVLNDVNAPLTPALSPFGGEREKTATCDNTPSPRPSGERVSDSSHRSATKAEGRVRGNFVSFKTFSEIRHPPVASVVLGFRREDVAHPCEGFGMLIPKIEGFKILGTIFSSSLFPNRAPTGHLTLTSYIGGERYPELALLPAEKLVALVCEDLRVLLGVTGKTTFEHCVLYPKAIPQYNVGYGRYRGLMNEIENKVTGLFFAGHYRDGVSLGDTIVSGVNIVERVAGFIGPVAN